MVTVSHLVKNIIKSKPFLQEALRQRIISYGNLAEQLKPKIDAELDKDIKHSAIVMALRRYGDELQDKQEYMKKFNYSVKLPSEKLLFLFRKIDSRQPGDMFNFLFRDASRCFVYTCLGTNSLVSKNIARFQPGRAQ